MEITYTLNNEVIFDLTGKDILKGVGKNLSMVLLLLILSCCLKEIVAIEGVEAFKVINNSIGL